MIAQAQGMANEHTTGTTIDIVGTKTSDEVFFFIKTLERLTSTPHTRSKHMPRIADVLTDYL